MTPFRRNVPRRDLGDWRRTAAWYRAPGISALGVGLGVAFGRADLVLLVAPLALVWILAVTRASPMLGSSAPRATTQVAPRSADAVITRVDDLEAVELVSVTQPDPWNGPVGTATSIAGGVAEAHLVARFGTEERGRTVVARPDILGAGPDGLYLAGRLRRGEETAAVVLPQVAEIAPLRLPPIIGGWTGAHVSRRPGQGSDLVDLREFTPGDRLKSIHWRAYARYQRLYTRRTLSDADAEIMVCLDLSTVIAPRAVSTSGTWNRLSGAVSRWWTRHQEIRDPDLASRRKDERMRAKASSTDHAIAAAVGLARAHLAQGDRVGMMTACVPRRLVRPSSGSKYLELIRHELARVDSRPTRLLDVAWWGLRPGQIVVWCSPLVTDASADAARECAARGHLVIVVDTLPMTELLRRSTAADADHLRVLLVERQLRIDRLVAEGIGVIAWESENWERDAAHVMRRRR